MVNETLITKIKDKREIEFENNLFGFIIFSSFVSNIFSLIREFEVSLHASRFWLCSILQVIVV